ncbi:MAG: HRDC domain-containing protein, partial [Pseudolabrys sp.]
APEQAEAALVELGTTFTDWSRRPLEAAQLRYAADDVRYLAQIYPRLRTELAEQGRLDWLSEDFTALTRPQTYAAPLKEAWRRVSGANRLRGVQLAILQGLAAWREQRAQAINKPRKWVLKDDVLTDLARHGPTDLKHLERIRGLDNAMVNRFGRDLLAVIRDAAELPKAQWPEPAPRLQLSAGQDALVDAMMAVLRQCAEQHRVSVPTLAARRDLEAIAAGQRDVPLLHGWRAALAGEAIDALMNGRLCLRVRDGQLVSEPTTA